MKKLNLQYGILNTLYAILSIALNVVLMNLYTNVVIKVLIGLYIIQVIFLVLCEFANIFIGNKENIDNLIKVNNKKGLREIYRGEVVKVYLYKTIIQENSVDLNIKDVVNTYKKRSHELKWLEIAITIILIVTKNIDHLTLFMMVIGIRDLMYYIVNKEEISLIKQIKSKYMNE